MPSPRIGRPNDQDNRHYAKLGKIPLLEPADSQEAKDFVFLLNKMKDYLLGFEWLETLRRLSYLTPNGMVLANDHRIDPMTVSSGEAEYPKRDTILSHLRQVAKRVYVIPGTETALELGEVRTFNIVVLGALSVVLKNDPEAWKMVIRERIPEKLVALNQKAFDKGRSLIRSSTGKSKEREEKN